MGSIDSDHEGAYHLVKAGRWAFDETGRWDEPLDWLQMERIRFTVSQLPAGVGSVLDVGCGRGDIANRVGGGVFVAACDLSVKGLVRVKAPRVRAEVSSLPFASSSFDFVICAEVLEHLTSSEMEAALEEMCRVSRRHVLLTVPYKEDLSRMLVRCKVCWEIFHAYGHLRSFDEGALERIHPRLRLVSRRTLCWPERAIGHGIQEFRRNLLGIFENHPNLICPSCGNRDFRCGVREYVLRKLTGLVNRLSDPGTVEQGWASALYVVEEKCG